MKKLSAKARKHTTLLVFIILFAVIGTSLLMLSRAAVAVNSVKSGNWSDPTVWGGRVPGAGDIVTLASGHTVTFDPTTSRVAGVRINSGAKLVFDTAKTVTLESSDNVLVEGELEMKPSSPTINHTLRFVGVNEAAMVGGGMNMLTTDTGLWVMGAGQLDIAGSSKTGWTRASSAIANGATSLALVAAPTGWRSGDEVSISPTESPSVGAASYTGFDEANVASVNGTTLTLNKATTRPHPQVNGKWTAEVMNLTRNVHLEGTPSGRAHILIRSTRPQTVNHASIRWMGANKAYRSDTGEPSTEVLGRYSLHFHHSLDGSRGSMVQGTVVRDGGGRSFVPHQSHGITFKDTVAYNTWRPAYWWDSQEPTNDVLMEHTIAAKTHFANDTKFRMTAFMHDAGERNTLRDSVVTGMVTCGCDDEGAGFTWPEIPDVGEHSGVWGWRDSISHNNAGNGLFVWQNTGVHVVHNYDGYYNGRYGIRHGAYLNAYRYVGGSLYGNRVGAVEMKAVGPLSFENMTWDGAGLSTHLFKSVGGQGESNDPIQMLNVTMRGFSERAVWMARPPTTGEGRDHSDRVNVIDSNITGNPFYLESSISPTSRVHFQNSSTAYQLRRADQTGGTLIAGVNAKRTDNVARIPRLAFTAPLTTDGIVAPGNVTFNVSATPGSNPIQRVEFSRDGGDSQTDTTAPYSFVFDTRTLRVPNGNSSYQVRAFDSAGNQSHVTGINVRAQENAPTPPPPDPDPDPEPEPDPHPDDTTAPTARITAPSNNVTVSGTITVQADASDNVGVDKVELFVNGSSRGSDTTAPYTFPLDTRQLANGQYSLTVRASDAAYNLTNSTPVLITINNQSFPPEDINQDGRVNLLDFSALAAKYGQQGSNLGRADINKDGRVNLQDFSLLAAKIG